jgi:hypothetical protein
VGFFSRGVKVGSPQPAAPVAGNRAFKAYNVIVQTPALQPPSGGDVQATILQHLGEIESFPPGLALLQGIQASGKQVGVKYMGPGNNQAAGAVRAYYVLRMQHDAGNAPAFAAEFTATIQRMTAAGKDVNWLANELYTVQVPLWNGGTMPSPFRGLAVARLPARPGAKPLPQLPTVPIVALINSFQAGTAMPSLDQMDALSLVLEPWMQAGLGAATRINYDPYKTMVNGVSRPPQVGLYHELVHAYYNVIGRQLGREDSINEGNGGRLFEAQAVGLGSFGTRTICENNFRAALGVQARTTYP